MSKEEILDKHWMSKNDVYAASENVLSAMDEYADIQCLGLLKFMTDNCYHRDKDNFTSFKDGEIVDFCSAQELVDLYINSKK